MQAVETFLKEVKESVMGQGVAETSGYPALSSLLNEIGGALKPAVRTIIHMRGNPGEGIPDGAFFSQEEAGKDDAETLRTRHAILGVRPRRGQIEVKGVAENLDLIKETDQVQGYLNSVPYLVLTNYWDYRLLTLKDGKIREGERFTLADSAADFRTKAAQPRKLAQAIGPRFRDFLQRALIHEAPLDAPKDLAWYLASYAREALARLDLHADAARLGQLRSALEEALGIKFREEEGEHFFRSSLVQTLFYGLFAAWVLWCQEPDRQESDVFRWQDGVDHLHIPAIKAIYHQVQDRTKLRALDLVPVLDWTALALNRVDRGAFFARFQQEHAVQYFYEPFLQEFDPALRKQLGVWYTPPEIVEYMVGRVDQVLKSELGIPAGLADDNVIVLDPCCGTGSFLVAVLERLTRTLQEEGAGELLGKKVKRAAKDRIFGFELMPAPFVVAHLQLGLLLQQLGAPLEEEERVGVYLTNALTGWEPLEEPKQTMFGFEELAEERDAAEHIKQSRKIIVVLGNPPYNAFAGVSPAEERGLVEPYKRGLSTEWKIKKYNLDDLYVRFFRLAERRIAEKSGLGIVCYISNFSYLSSPSFVVMRQRFLQEFDSIWIDCMNGDSRETGKLTPEGLPDPSVFSTEYNREGIQVGTAIGMLMRKRQRAESATIRFRHFWGVSKRADLLASLQDPAIESRYELAKPSKQNRFSLRPMDTRASYAAWPQLTSLALVDPMNGLMEKRGGALVSIDHDLLKGRMQMYFDSSVTWERLVDSRHPLTKKASGFNPIAARNRAIAEEGFLDERIVRYLVRPFDVRWAYYTNVNSIWNRARPDLWRQCWQGNRFILSRPAGIASKEGVPGSFSSILGDNDFQKGHACYFPFSILQGSIAGESIFADHLQHRNHSRGVVAYLAELDMSEACIWEHVLAQFCALKYLTENASALRVGWPRIPLPASPEQLNISVALGRQTAALLDPEAPVEGVSHNPTGAFRALGVLSTKDGGRPNLALTANWGYLQQGRRTQPGAGKFKVRPYTSEERAVLGEEAMASLGESTVDVWLNDTTYWRNVPIRVWQYTIGGYQVLKKWLSYREEKLLGRPLKLEEVEYVQEVVRRLAGLCLLEPALDANYLAVKANTYPWPQD